MILSARMASRLGARLGWRGMCGSGAAPMDSVVTAVTRQAISGRWRVWGVQGETAKVAHFGLEVDAKMLEEARTTRRLGTQAGKETALNARHLATLRKLCAETGLLSPIERRGGAEKQPIRGFTFKKGKAHARKAAARQEKIQTQMEKMDDLVAARQKVIKKAKQPTGLEAQLEGHGKSQKKRYTLEDLYKDLD